jgi:hypothetical protein
MHKHKVTINLDAETKQQLEAAATEKLVEDGELQPDQVDSERWSVLKAEVLQEIEILNAAILAHDEGEEIDLISTIIELNRCERVADILGLR